MADAYFERERFDEFCAKHLSHLDEVAWEYFKSGEFDDMLVSTVKGVFPDHEHEMFIAHFRGLLSHWVASEEARVTGGDSKPSASELKPPQPTTAE
jgi:hypothetical protein